MHVCTWVGGVIVVELNVYVIGGAIVFAAGLVFLLLGDYLKSQKAKAKKAGKRVEQRAVFSQIAAAEVSGKGRPVVADRKAGFGRR